MSHRFPPLSTPAPSRAKITARRLDLPNLPWFELMAWATFLMLLRQG